MSSNNEDPFMIGQNYFYGDGEIRIGEITYRDQPKDGEIQLRLGCEVIVSAGYSDSID